MVLDLSLTASSSCTINLLLSSSTCGCPSIAVLKMSLQRSSRSLTSLFEHTRTLKSCVVSSRSPSSIFTAKHSPRNPGSDVDFMVRLRKPSLTVLTGTPRLVVLNLLNASCRAESNQHCLTHQRTRREQLKKKSASLLGH